MRRRARSVWAGEKVSAFFVDESPRQLSTSNPSAALPTYIFRQTQERQTATTKGKEGWRMRAADKGRVFGTLQQMGGMGAWEEE